VLAFRRGAYSGSLRVLGLIRALGLAKHKRLSPVAYLRHADALQHVLEALAAHALDGERAFDLRVVEKLHRLNTV